MNDNAYEYALFKIKDPEKFSKFMLQHLNMLKDNEEFGFQVVILGCGKEPFEWEDYTEYLENVKATDSYHPFYLTLDEWIKMGRPKKGSDELSKKIEQELT